MPSPPLFPRCHCRWALPDPDSIFTVSFWLLVLSVPLHWPVLSHVFPHPTLFPWVLPSTPMALATTSVLGSRTCVFNTAYLWVPQAPEVQTWPRLKLSSAHRICSSPHTHLAQGASAYHFTDAEVWSLSCLSSLPTQAPQIVQACWFHPLDISESVTSSPSPLLWLALILRPLLLGSPPNVT